MSVTVMYTAKVMVWGVYENEDRAYIPTLYTLKHGFNVGHSAMMLEFESTPETEALLDQYIRSNEELNPRLRKTDKGSYEFYFSFWPDEEGDSPHYFASYEEDLKWERYGVAASWNKKFSDLKRIADNRKARGWFGARTPYKLGAEIITHMPNAEKAFINSTIEFFNHHIEKNNKQLVTFSKSKALIDDYETIKKDSANMLKMHQQAMINEISAHMTYLKGLSHEQPLSAEASSQKDNSLYLILYAYGQLYTQNRNFNNALFKLSQTKIENNDERKKIKMLTELYINQIEDNKKVLFEIESAIPHELRDRMTKGLLPTSTRLPMSIHGQPDNTLSLESMLKEANNISKNKVKYKFFSLAHSENCSSTVLRLLYTGLRNATPQARKLVKKHKILPDTPQHVHLGSLSVATALTRKQEVSFWDKFLDRINQLKNLLSSLSKHQQTAKNSAPKT